LGQASARAPGARRVQTAAAARQTRGRGTAGMEARHQPTGDGHPRRERSGGEAACSGRRAGEDSSGGAKQHPLYGRGDGAFECASPGLLFSCWRLLVLFWQFVVLRGVCVVCQTSQNLLFSMLLSCCDAHLSLTHSRSQSKRGPEDEEKLQKAGHSSLFPFCD
jgi:hypothetical protein